MLEKRGNVEAKIKRLFKRVKCCSVMLLSEVSSSGCTLSFVRGTSEVKLAIVQLDNGAATIDEDSEIDPNANINLRD